MNQDWTAGRKYSEFCFYWNRREVSLYLSFHAIPSNCFLWHKNTSRAKHFSKIMWHLNSLNWEENSGRYFDPGKRKIYKAMVHYAMITSGMGLLWKWTLVTDLITKQPATTLNIYFSKPRWTFRAQFLFCFFFSLLSFSRASRWIVCLLQLWKAPFPHITHQAHPIDPADWRTVPFSQKK